MLSTSTLLALVPLLAAVSTSAQYSATYDPNNLPATTEDGQTGTNKCGSGSSQTSMCQNAYINSVTDFCLWAPPSTTSDYGNSAIGNTERIEVAWCINSGYGTRQIPSGTISGAHFIKTPNFIQITGTGNLQMLNIPAGDDGGELDPHGADGNGNPIGGLVFSSAFTGSNLEQIFEWSSYISSNAFSFRACKNAGDAAQWCPHIYDTIGAGWNHPGNYDSGYSNCLADSGEVPGVYGGSTFYQGQEPTPAAHAAGASSQCTQVAILAGGAAVITTAVTTSSTSSSASSSQSTTVASTSSMSSSASTTSMSSSGSSSAASSGASSAATSATSSRATSTSASSASAAAATTSRSAGTQGVVFGGVGAVLVGLLTVGVVAGGVLGL